MSRSLDSSEGFLYRFWSSTISLQQRRWFVRKIKWRNEAQLLTALDFHLDNYYYYYAISSSCYWSTQLSEVGELYIIIMSLEFEIQKRLLVMIQCQNISLNLSIHFSDQVFFYNNLEYFSFLSSRSCGVIYFITIWKKFEPVDRSNVTGHLITKILVIYY